jgi:hypothetical protein
MKEASSLATECGWALPFPRTGCAPRATPSCHYGFRGSRPQGAKAKPMWLTPNEEGSAHPDARSRTHVRLPRAPLARHPHITLGTMGASLPSFARLLASTVTAHRTRHALAGPANTELKAIRRLSGEYSAPPSNNLDGAKRADAAGLRKSIRQMSLLLPPGEKARFVPSRDRAGVVAPSHATCSAAPLQDRSASRATPDRRLTPLRSSSPSSSLPRT